jgi:hypothetical protein
MAFVSVVSGGFFQEQLGKNYAHYARSFYGVMLQAAWKRFSRSDHVHERSAPNRPDFEAPVSRTGWLGVLQPCAR